MSFSENIEEDKTIQRIYEKIIFDDFHKITKQIKQQNNKRYVYRSPGLPGVLLQVASGTVPWE